MEMSEVMATQFTEMFLSQKKRTADAQIMLVKGLRILCDVFLARGKLQRAIASVKTLHRERKKLIRLLAKSAPHLLEKMTAPAEDYRRAGKIYATAGKNGAAMKAFSKCEKLSPGHVASAMEACTLLGFDKKRVNRFLNTIQAAGPVILSSGRFQLQPPHLPEADAHEVMAILQSAVEAGIGSTDVSKRGHSDLRRNRCNRTRRSSGKRSIASSNGSVKTSTRLLQVLSMVTRDGFEPSISGL